jgi:hypothetical protein
MRTVARISFTPVRTFRIQHVDAIVLGPDGFDRNRRFMLVDGDGTRLRSSATSWPVVLHADYDPLEERLRVTFPDGRTHEADGRGSGETVHPTVGDRTVEATVVPGPWEDGLAELAGHPVRIVRVQDPRDAFTSRMPVTVVSDGSRNALGEAAGGAVDLRRFRMLFELAGCEPHEEDAWEGSRIQVGGAVLRIGGGVERCAMTTRDPQTGERDLDTLRLIRSYRGRRASDGAILFGVYADVEQSGSVRVGDPVEPL